MRSIKRSLSSKRSYKNSALAARNASLKAASELQALRVSDPLFHDHLAAGRLNPARVTELAQMYVQDGTSGAHIDAGREPYLLREDILNPGELTTVEIYDVAVAGVGRDGCVAVELPRGRALLPSNTLVYWR